MSREISKYDDIIDSRDIIARIEDLESMKEAAQEVIDDAEAVLEEAQLELGELLADDDVSDDDEVVQRARTAVDEAEETLTLARNNFEDDWHEDADLGRELNALLELQEEAQSSPDWQYGQALINDDYFVEYTKQLVDDCYEMPKAFDSGDWPWRHMTMDWEGAADDLKQDYFEVDFDGVTFWIRD